MSTLVPMTRLASSFKLFSYAGRENGLMIVGSREAMQELATKLQAALASEPVPVTKDWPPELVAATVQLGPYRSSLGYELSLHIEGAVPAEMKVPLRRKSPPGALVAALLALAVVGLLSVLEWLKNGF